MASHVDGEAALLDMVSYVRPLPLEMPLITDEEAAMSDMSQSHMRHHQYTYRLPTPPRIVVPPPTLTTEMPELNMGTFAGTPNEDIDTRFLKEMIKKTELEKNTMLDWAYERRREAQKILPWLFLGPFSAAKDRNFICDKGITMILAIRTQRNSMNGALQAANAIVQEVATIEAPDYFSLVGYFPQTTKMINHHLAKIRKFNASGHEQMGKVLVFCESGNEKSAAVVAAYLMEMLDGFDHIKAMQVCQAQRFCVNFDDSLKNVLRSYWDILQAKRAVADANVADTNMDLYQDDTPTHSNRQTNLHLQVQTLSLSRPKRTIEDTRDDDDVEMEDGMDPSDVLRFHDRDMTPFQDS
jgi:serine/threonine/tyrosine-interacting protein